MTDGSNHRRILAAVLGAILSFAVPAQSYAVCDVTDGNKNPLNPIDLGTWDGVSSITVSSPEVCIVSSAGSAANASPIPYRVAAVNLPPVGSDTSFRLYNLTDPAQSFPITVRWLNPKFPGAQNEALTPGALTSTQYDGRNKQGCQNQTFDTNGQMQVSVDGATLQSLALPPGTYTTDLQVTPQSLFLEDCTPTVANPTLVIPGGLVKIGNLDDIVLTWSGVGDLTYNEPFCVYSNTGTYALTPSTATLHLGDPQSFALENTVVVGDTVPYTVQVDDDANADASLGTSTTNGLTVGGLTGNPTEPDCISGDNAAVFIRLLESDLQGLTGLNYSGTLVLTVEPL
jgi:hypothetical protein